MRQVLIMKRYNWSPNENDQANLPGNRLRHWHSVQNLILKRIAEESRTSSSKSDSTNAALEQDLTPITALYHAEPIFGEDQISVPGGTIFLAHSSSDIRTVTTAWLVDEDFHISKKAFPTMSKLVALKYLPKQRKIVGCTADMKLKLFSDITHDFKELCQEKLVSTASCIERIPDTDELIVGGAGFLVNLKVSEDAFLEGRPLNLVLRPTDVAVKLLVDSANKQLLVLCQNAMFILHYVRNMLTHRFENKHETALTSCAFYKPLNYFVTASKDGSLKVWNSTTYRLVREVSAHSKSITDVFPYTSEPLLLTSSYDGIIKIWRLDSLELHFKFDIGDPILSMRMLKDGKMYVVTSHQIRIYEHRMYHHYYATTNSQTLRLEKISSSQYPSVILCSTQDGSIFVLNAVAGKCKTSVIAVKMFQECKDVIYIRSENQLYVLMDNDNVAVLDTSTNPSTGSYVIESGKDPKEHILSLALIQRSMAVGRDNGSRQDDLIFAGLQSGEIILLHSLRSKMAGVCRGHRVPVVILRASKTATASRSNKESIGNCQRLLSISSDGVLKVWGIKEAELDSEIFTLVNLKMVDLGGPVFTLCMIGASLAYVTKEESASVKIVSLETLSPNQQKLRAWEASHALPPAKRSPRTVTDLNGCPFLCIFCTTCNDGSLWIWDNRGLFLRRLQFDETLHGCCFGDNKGTIIIGVRNHLSFITVAEYYPVEKLKQLLLEDIEDDEAEESTKWDHGASLSLDVSVMRRHAIDRQSFNLETSESNHQDSASDVEAPEDTQAQTSKASMWKKTLMAQKLKSRLSLKLGRRTSSAKASEDAKAEPDVPRTENSDSVAHAKKKKHVFSKAEFDSAVKDMQMTKEQRIKEEKRRASLEFIKKLEEQKRKKKYWPIAPDGIVPNSVIRGILEQTAALLPESERSKLGEMSFMMAKLKFLNLKTTEGQLPNAHENATKRSTRKLIPDKVYTNSAEKEISLLSVEYHHAAITPLQWDLAMPSKNVELVPIAFAEGGFVDTSLPDVNEQNLHEGEEAVELQLQHSLGDLMRNAESVEYPTDESASKVTIEPSAQQSYSRAEQEDLPKSTVGESLKTSREGAHSTAISLPQFKERKYKAKKADYSRRSDAAAKLYSASTRSVPTAFTGNAAAERKNELIVQGDPSAANEDTGITTKTIADEAPTVTERREDALEDSAHKVGSQHGNDVLSIRNTKPKMRSHRTEDQADTAKRTMRANSSTASLDAQRQTWRQQQHQRDVSSAQSFSARSMAISGGGKAILLKKREPRPPRRAWGYTRGAENVATESPHNVDPVTNEGQHESFTFIEAEQTPALPGVSTPFYQSEAFDESYLFPPLRFAKAGEQTDDFFGSEKSSTDNAESEDDALPLNPRKSTVKEIYDLSERYVKDYLRHTWSGSSSPDSRLLFPAIANSGRQATPISGAPVIGASSGVGPQVATEEDTLLYGGAAGSLNVWENAIDTSTLKRIHSDYCNYYKMARKKFQQYLSIYKTQHSMDVIKRMCMSRRDYRRRLLSP